MRKQQTFQFGLRALLAAVTAAGVGLGIHTCPPPLGPLLMKVAGGFVLFVPVLLAVYFADWFGRRL
ncbi:MAG TPA: hypothetical protein VHC22_09900 [Pirellulales bacterium]|nr:hypothetical protein [Pirellulales bacterium]